MATRYAVANGNWNSTSTWSATSGGAAGASVPGTSDQVYIVTARTVTLDVNASVDSIYVGGGGTLNTSYLNLTVQTDFVLGKVSLFAGDSAATVNLGSGTHTSRERGIYVGTLTTLDARYSQIVIEGDYSGHSITGSGKNLRNVTLNLRYAAPNTGYYFTIYESVIFKKLIINSVSDYTHTVNISHGDGSAKLVADNILFRGKSTAKPLRIVTSVGMVSPASGWVAFKVNEAMYAKNTSFESSSATFKVSVLGPAKAYAGTTSVATNYDASLLLQDPPKAETLVDPLLAPPSATSRFKVNTAVSSTVPTLVTSGVAGGGYKFMSSNGTWTSIASNDTYDLAESSIFFQLPVTMNDSGPSDSFEFTTSSFSLYYDSTSGNYKTATVSSGTSGGYMWPANLAGVMYIKISLTGTTLKVENSSDGVAWSEETSSPITWTVDPDLYRSLQFKFSQYTGSLSSGTYATLGAVNTLATTLSPTYRFDGHNGITDPNNAWGDDTKPFNGTFSSTNYAYNSLQPYATNGTKSLYYLSGAGTTAPTSGDTPLDVYARTQYGIGTNMTIYQTFYDVSTELDPATIPYSPASGAFSTWYRIPPPSGGWTWSKINTLTVRSYAYYEDYMARWGGTQIVVVKGKKTGNPGAFFAFF